MPGFSASVVCAEPGHLLRMPPANVAQVGSLFQRPEAPMCVLWRCSAGDVRCERAVPHYESTDRQICARGLRPLQGESASGSESTCEFEDCVVRRSDRRLDLEVVSGVLVGGYRLSAREASESVAAFTGYGVPSKFR